MNEETLFAEAVAIASPRERNRFLDEKCGDNAKLRSAVEQLLRLQDDAGSFLETPPEELTSDATQLFAGDTSGEEDRPREAADPTIELELDNQVPLDFLAPSTTRGSLGRLGQYEIQSVIGRGGMGIVLQAHDSKLSRTVAVKVLAPEFAANAGARKRFLREAKSAAAISHPHVVTIHGVDDEGVPYLVMECVDGKSLAQKIAEQGTLEVKEILRIGAQIAAGLAAAHKQGLIHRDIKPANILLENGVERVKITDFGLARAIDDLSVTRTGEIAGTPQFMSPEQAGGQEVDQRSDLFSLGSVLYTMCTGRSPFRAESTIAVIRRVCDDTPRPIREVNPDIPEWLATIIDRLLAKNPGERYQTAEEVSELLSDHLAHLQHPQRIPATPVVKSTPEPVASRGRGWLVAAAAVILLIGLGLTEATGVTRVASTVIRLATGSGTLVIETDDPDVKIAIDGETVTIRGGGVEELTLRPGEYKVAAHKDGVLVKQELVSISRNGRTVVRISLEPTDAAPKTAGETPSETAGEHSLPPKLEPVTWPADAPPLAIAPFDTDQAKRHQQAWADYLSVPVQKVIVVGQDMTGKDVTLTMALIPPGEFLMGSTEEDQARFLQGTKALNEYDQWWTSQRIQWEVPQHRVRITRPFYLGKYEVTQAQWQVMMGNNPSGHQGSSYPLENVNWQDIQPFLGKLNQLSTQPGMNFALPTEAQWEYACRAGTQTAWHFGNDESAIDEYGWCKLNSDGETHAVGQLRPNGFGLYDMHGNVWELCADWSLSTYYADSPANDPVGPATGVDLALRGGSWRYHPQCCRSAFRACTKPDAEGFRQGFRVVAAISEDLLQDKLKATAGRSPQALFNGRDLSGWKTHPDQPGNWRVEDGVLVSSGTPSYLFTERDDYGDFELSCEVSISKHGDGGILVRTPFVNAGKDGLPGYEAQIQSGNVLAEGWATGAIGQSVPGSGWKLHQATAPQVEADTFFPMRVRVQGNHIETWVYGEKAAEYDDPERTYSRGHIALQHSGADTVVRFRKIEVRELPHEPQKNVRRFTSGEKFTSKDGKYAVRFPAQPRETTVTNKTPGGDLKNFIAEHRDSQGRGYIVSYADYPMDYRPDPKVLLDAIRDDLKGENGRVTSDENVPFGPVGVPGRDVYVEWDTHHLRDRVLWRDNRLYHVQVYGSREFVTGKEAQTFFQSFELLNPLNAVSPPPAIAPFDAAQAKGHQEAWARNLGVPIEKEIILGKDQKGKDVTLTMVLIPPGEFLMGSTDEQRIVFLKEGKAVNETWGGDRIPHEGPQHRVRITMPFWLAKHEISIAQFRRFAAAEDYKTDAERDGKGGYGFVDEKWMQAPRFVWNGDLGFPQTDDHPVVNVSWNDTTAFCDWLTRRGGEKFALPTEAQWEYACRAGTTTAWHSGDSEENLRRYVWFRRAGEDKTQPVGQLQPNGFGLYDMHGNVWEWCADQWTSDYSIPPQDAGGGELSRVHRGGAWTDHPRRTRSAFRSHRPASMRVFQLGFRVAAEVESPVAAPVP